MILSIIKKNILLSCIVSFGFLLRISLLFWGMPVTPDIYCPDIHSVCFHADEADAVSPAVDFPGNYLSSDRFLGYGTVLPYLAGASSLPFKLFLHNSFSYGLLVWALERLYSVLFGTGSILLTYLLANILFQNRRVAQISTLFVAISPEHLLASATAKPSILESFLILLSYLLLFRALQEKSKRSFTILGIVIGLLLGSKITGILFIIPFLLGVLIERISFKLIVRSLFFALCIFILFHPYIFIHPGVYVSYLFQEKYQWIDRTLSSLSNLIHTWVILTNTAHGFPISYIVPFGLLLWPRKIRLHEVLFFLYIIIYYLFWRWAITRGYIGIITPMLCIYVSLALCALIRNRLFLFRVAGFTILIGSILSTGIVSGLALYARWNDPRIDAARYINDSVPQGTMVGFSVVTQEYGWIEHIWRYPRIDISHYNVVDFLDAPEFLIISSFDIDEVTGRMNSPYLSRQYVWDERFNKVWYKYIPPSPEVFRFYDEMFRKGTNTQYKLLKSFKTNIPVMMLTDPYPDIYIYQRKG